MARHKRVSVQGKGADLFFGDLHTATEVEEERAKSSSPTEEGQLHTQIEHTHAQSTPVSPENVDQESKHASNGVDRNERSAELISSLILDAIWRDVSEQATVTNAFRYTHEELGQLNDAIYELGKEYGTRVTKQEVARLSLNAILTDYQIRGAESFLSTFIARRSNAG